MPAGILLFALFLGVPLIEIALFIEIGGWIGLWPTLGLVVLTALIGSFTIRAQGFNVARRARGRLDSGRLPVREAFDGLCLLVAGALLLTPGFFTDAVGGVLLLPPVRGRVYSFLAARLQAAATEGGDDSGPGRPGGRQEGVIDVDYEVVDNEHDPDMPPPKGGWRRGS